MTKFKIISLSIIILLAACGDVTPTEIRKEDVLSENFRDAYRALEPINILGQSYMVSDIRHYPVLNMWCNDGDKKTFIDIELRPGWEGEDGDIVYSNFHQTGEIDMTARIGKFWDHGIVYFDEEKTPIPASTRTMTKKVLLGDGKYETRSARIVTDPRETIYAVLLPNLKTSKTMRIENTNGRPSTFELDGIKDKIEKLETQCLTFGEAWEAVKSIKKGKPTH